MQCGVGLFGQTLLEFLAFEDGLQAAIEHSFNVFRNPVFVFDTNFNLIAATWEAIKKLNIKDPVGLRSFTDKPCGPLSSASAPATHLICSGTGIIIWSM